MSKRIFYFVVQGLGTFPIEMLRYDRCLPFSEDDAYVAMRSDNSRDGPRRLCPAMAGSGSIAGQLR
jgi:hypothetical protein